MTLESESRADLTAARSDVVVLASFPRPQATTNPYITQLASVLEQGDQTSVVYFSWSAALRGRYDVVHLHWPETLLRARTSTRKAAKLVLVFLWCVRLHLTSTPVIRTWHNVHRPDGLRYLDHRLLDWLDRLTRARIRLNESTQLPPGSEDFTILHGHYRNWFGQFERRDQVPGRVAFVGRVRPYKGVEHLIATFSSHVDDQLSLSVAGLPESDAVRSMIENLAAADPRIHLELRYVDDATLVAHVSESQLVVLPYKHMHNSGAALAALSLNRPVLMPNNQVNRHLATEVGCGWVRLFDEDLSVEDLVGALRAGVPIDQPDLSMREWDRAAKDHLEAYRAALIIARDGKARRTP